MSRPAQLDGWLCQSPVNRVQRVRLAIRSCSSGQKGDTGSATVTRHAGEALGRALGVNGLNAENFEVGRWYVQRLSDMRLLSATSGVRS